MAEDVLILGIESSSLVASAALTEDGVVLAEYTLNYKKTHSQTLLPMIDEIVKMTELDLHQLDAIAAAGGPGSFTGLRIGTATAKGLGLALNKPLIHVPTVDAMAYNLWGCADLICPIMDARRGQVYTGIYRCREELETVKSQCAMDMRDLAETLNAMGEPVVFLGDGVPVFKGQIEETVKVPFRFAPAQSSRQRAASVAALGEIYFRQGKTVSAAEFRSGRWACPPGAKRRSSPPAPPPLRQCRRRPGPDWSACCAAGPYPLRSAAGAPGSDAP